MTPQSVLNDAYRAGRAARLRYPEAVLNPEQWRQFCNEFAARLAEQGVRETASAVDAFGAGWLEAERVRNA